MPGISSFGIPIIASAGAWNSRGDRKGVREAEADRRRDAALDLHRLVTWTPCQWVGIVCQMGTINRLATRRRRSIELDRTSLDAISLTTSGHELDF